MTIQKTNNNIILVFGLLIVFVAGLIRFWHLDMDPPVSLGLHFISDEGWWSHNARNKILFGQWKLDEFNQGLLVSPTYCYATYIAFKVFGVGLASARIVPAISGFLSVLLFGMILKQKKIPDYIILMSMLFLGFSFGFVTLNRIAYVDSTAFLFILSAWWFLENRRYGSWKIILAGIASGLALVTKSYVLTLLPIFIILLFVRAVSRKTSIIQILSHCVLFSIGVGIVGIIWYIAVYIPNSVEYKIMYYLWKDGNVPGSIRQAVRNIPAFFFQKRSDGVYLSRFVLLNFPLFILLWYRCIQLSGRDKGSIKNALRQIPFFEKEAFIWLFMLIMCIAPLTAKPFRRYIFLYPPLILIAVSTITATTRTLSSSKTTMSFKFIRTFIWVIFPILLLTPFVSRNLFPISENLSINKFQIHSSQTISSQFIISIAVVSLIFLLLSFLPRPRISVKTSNRSLFILVLFLLFNGLFLWNMFSYSTDSMKQTSKELGNQYFKPGTIVLGGIADTLCLENKARAIAIWGREEAERVLNENPVERFNPDYLLILISIDGIPWGAEDRYLRYADKNNFIKEIRLLPLPDGNHRVISQLYSLKP
ncbi:phospholipid carrier-dependent glycosyltransferase [bacterium]|nr:phospholipid carrier-dependent glycosyltransferase [candidate division CSSED10-310 bacterium]